MRCALIALSLSSVPYFPASALPKGWKANGLPGAEEKKWIEAVKHHETADGATVWQVLEHVQKMRPKKFKIGVAEAVYDGGSGEPDGVGISAISSARNGFLTIALIFCMR